MSAEYINRGSEVIVGDAVGVTTMEDLPGGPPKEVTIVPISSSGSDLEIKWQVCFYLIIYSHIFLHVHSLACFDGIFCICRIQYHCLLVGIVLYLI